MSIDLKMAWRNIWRNPRRSILTICAILFASGLLVFSLSWQFGSYETMINASLKVYTGHLQIQAEGYKDKMEIHDVISDPSPVKDILSSLPYIESYASRGKAFSLVSSEERTYGIMITGIDPPKEAAVTTLEKIIRKGDYLHEQDTNQALIGELLAKNLRVDINYELTVLGQARDGSIAATFLTIKGIFRSGQDEFDRSSLFMPLTYFQEIFAMDRAVHEIVVVGTSIKKIPEIKKAISSKIKPLKQEYPLVALDWEELLPGLRQGINLDLVSGLIFYFILILVVAFSILNTFLMAILERTREFGLLMALGTKPARIIRLLLYESGFMIILGDTLGVITGGLVTWYFQVHGIRLSGASEIMKHFGIPEVIYPRLSLLSVSIGSIAVFIITFLVALYPAFKIKWLRPVEALVYT